MENRRAITIVIVLLLLIVFVSALGGVRNVGQQSTSSVKRPPSPTLSIGNTTLSLLIADTQAQQEKGLGDRRSLPASQGMLFVFDTIGDHLIWMKDMLFSIDILWLDRHFFVVDIKEHATPQSYPDIFRPRELNSYVLEVNDGFVQKNHIKIGDRFIPEHIPTSF